MLAIIPDTEEDAIAIANDSVGGWRQRRDHHA